MPDGVRAFAVGRDVLRVTGPDALDWLQGQLSQDLLALADGASAWSLVLQPQGKVDALLRVTRLAADHLVLDTDAGWGEHVAARLNRFRLRVKADVEPLDWRGLALRGPGAEAVAAGPDTIAAAPWPTMAGVDLLGPSPSPPAGAEPGDLDAYEALRIEAGLPAMGAELDERTIPAEAGVVEHAVSFTKGCYTGQELVARIDSRGGRVPRNLRGLLIEGDDVPPRGATLTAGDRQVGTVTSAARSPALGVVALAYVRRDVEPPAAATVEWEGSPGAPAARIEALPLARP